MKGALCKVDVEKVQVKSGLHQSSCDSNGIHHVLRNVSVGATFEHENKSVEAHVPINPVGKVQSTINTQSSQVMRCDCLRFTGALQHE